jgi:hypothetical protein
LERWTAAGVATYGRDWHPAEFGSEQGKRIALGDYMPTNVTIAKPEPVFANVFTLQLPQTMLIYDLYAAMSSAEREALRKKWAFVEANPYRLLAFTPPPPNSIPATKPERTPEFLWAETPERDGKRSEDVAKELVRRSLWVVCGEKGLEYCADRDLYYFPKRDNNEWNQKIRHVDGRNTRVALTGARTLGWGDRASPFTYQLAPLFQPQHDADGTWSVVVRVYVRPTDLDGKLYELKAIGRRRKSVTKSWWNKDWLARLLGVVQALETSVGEVRYGEGKRAVVMSSEPLRWECPVSLDVQALSGMVDLGEELAEFKAREGDEDDSDESSDPQTEKQSA